MKIAVCDDEIILYEELYTLLNEYLILKKEPILTTYFKTGYDLIKYWEVWHYIYGLSDGRYWRIETSKRSWLKIQDVIIFLTAFPKIVFQSLR